MAHARVLIAAVSATATSAFALSCASAVPAAVAPGDSDGRSGTAGVSGEASRLPRYRSKRLGLSLPLPDGQAWRIDDHSRPELVATHAATRSTVRVAVLRAPANVGRSQCENLARDAHLVPAGAMETLDEETTVTQGTFDTEVRVGLFVGDRPGEPLVGHVLAFGGSLRKCYVFDYSTEVDGAAQEPALSARLAFARTRILGGLELDGLSPAVRDGEVPRSAPRDGNPAR
ncbi:MAG: hypothetical protein FWD17_09210 [Polyangiaceae bacterium]|nr:hypothetical protein [Polyangiaceae bacterium]